MRNFLRVPRRDDARDDSASKLIFIVLRIDPIVSAAQLA